MNRLPDANSYSELPTYVALGKVVFSFRRTSKLKKSLISGVAMKENFNTKTPPYRILPGSNKSLYSAILNWRSQLDLNVDIGFNEQ